MITQLFFSDNKLLEVKMELEKIQRDRENHLKTIKIDYENFQVSKVLIIPYTYVY